MMRYGIVLDLVAFVLIVAAVIAARAGVVLAATERTEAGASAPAIDARAKAWAYVLQRWARARKCVRKIK